MKFKNWFKSLTIKRKNKLIKEITKLAVNIYINNKCPKCERTLPNKIFFTKNGCLWCDAKYHQKKLRKQKLGH